MNSFFYIKYDHQYQIIAQSNTTPRQFSWDLELLFFLLYLTKYNISLGIHFEIQSPFVPGKNLSLINGEQYTLETLLHLHNRHPRLGILAQIIRHFPIRDDITIQRIIEDIQSSSDTQIKKVKYLQALRQVSYEISTIFKPRPLFIKGHKLEPLSVLVHLGLVDAMINLSSVNKEFIVSYKEQGKRLYLNIGGIFDDRQYDYLLPYLIKNSKFQLEYQQIPLRSPVINIAGDTYFGEYYTNIRKKRKIEDALQKYGYSHSLEKIAPLFDAQDFNIVNFEAAMTTRHNSALNLQKPFILYADPQPTLSTLKHFNFHCATLANNHAMDFGEATLAEMLQGFKQHDIHTVGAGLDQNQATRFLELNYHQQKIAIFNGYWSKIKVLNSYDYFALADQAGVNSINGILYEQIKAYKDQHPDHLICCICHWGLDFQPIHPYQTHLAHKLIDFGADLIIGHGAHTIQQIEYYKNKPIVYSIGNAIFNSNGEYEKHQALPYGFLAKLNIENLTLSLYPIFTNNLKTFWQPDFVTQDQFDEIMEFLDIQPIIHQDELGFSLQLQLTQG